MNAGIRLSYCNVNFTIKRRIFTVPLDLEINPRFISATLTWVHLLEDVKSTGATPILSDDQDDYIRSSAAGHIP